MAFFVPALITGLSALAGGLANRTKKQETSGSSTTNSNTSSTTNATGSQLPVYDPLQLKMRDYLINQFYNQTNPNAIGGLVSSYTNNAINNVNQAAGPQEQALRAALAARGLSYSGAAGTALGTQQSNRIGQITGLASQSPLLEDQLRQSRLTSFSDFLSRLPVGSQSSSSSTSTGTGSQTTNQQGTVTTPGDFLGGAGYSLANSLANLFGAGAFGGGSPALRSGTGNLGV